MYLFLSLARKQILNDFSRLSKLRIAFILSEFFDDNYVFLIYRSYKIPGFGAEQGPQVFQGSRVLLFSRPVSIT